jgi:hypothetical protein
MMRGNQLEGSRGWDTYTCFGPVPVTVLSVGVFGAGQEASVARRRLGAIAVMFCDMAMPILE